MSTFEGGQSAPTQLDRIEWKLDQLLQAVRSSEVSGGDRPPTLSELVGQAVAGKMRSIQGQLPAMTTKQHVALQLLMLGKGNPYIGDVLGVTDNTAKVHVRTIAKKFGVRTRAEICLMAERALLGVDADTYKQLSGGLPRDWGERYVELREGETDPFADLYLNTGEDHDGE